MLSFLYAEKEEQYAPHFDSSCFQCGLWDLQEKCPGRRENDKEEHACVVGIKMLFTISLFLFQKVASPTEASAEGRDGPLKDGQDPYGHTLSQASDHGHDLSVVRSRAGAPRSHLPPKIHGISRHPRSSFVPMPVEAVGLGTQQQSHSHLILSCAWNSLRAHCWKMLRRAI